MDRLATGCLSEVLATVAPAIAAGSVNMISVEAIRERSGDRWARKRDQVEAFAERAFQRLAPAGSLIVALSDVEFLTIQPTARLPALSLSANVLRDILTYFLGAADRPDMRLFQVTSFADGELGLQRIDTAIVLDGDATADAPPGGVAGATAVPAASPLLTSAAGGRSKTIRFVAQSGLALELSFEFQPIWNLRGQAVTSVLLHAGCSVIGASGALRQVRSDELFSPDAGEVAIQTLGQACRLIASGANVGVHTPLPMNAVSYSTTRYRLLRALRDVGPEVRSRLFLEITEVPAGIPSGRIAELVAMTAPYCRAVLARAASELADLRAWRRAGLAGVTLDCSHLDASDRRVHVRLSAFGCAAAEVGPACIGYGVASRSLLVAAWAAGFTHLGGAPVAAEFGSDIRAQRLRPREIFGAGSAGDLALSRRRESEGTLTRNSCGPRKLFTRVPARH